MADENDTSPAIEGAEPSMQVTAAEPKKQRKPRQKKVIAEATAPASPAVKSPRKKRSAPSVEVTTSAPAAASESKPAKGRKPGPQPKAAATPSVAKADTDEMVDLIALEAENKRLRQALSEKLRAENADLRKKLGQA